MRWRSDRATGPTCTARRGRRYSHEMQSACSLASAAHSASWLRELEGADVLNRVPYQENGMRTRHEYRLTSRASRPTPGPPSGCELHLVGPLGFDLSDAYLRRAGLDSGSLNFFASFNASHVSSGAAVCLGNSGPAELRACQRPS